MAEGTVTGRLPDVARTPLAEVLRDPALAEAVRRLLADVPVREPSGTVAAFTNYI